jgi:hypothetical protein
MGKRAVEKPKYGLATSWRQFAKKVLLSRVRSGTQDYRQIWSSALDYLANQCNYYHALVYINLNIYDSPSKSNLSHLPNVKPKMQSMKYF